MLRSPLNPTIENRQPANHPPITHLRLYTASTITTNDGETFEASIEIVEWRMPNERRMYFCDGSGFPLDDTSPGIQAPGFSFTAYLKSDYFAKLLAENRLEIANLDVPTSKLLDAAKNAMRDHFRRRASEKAAATARIGLRT